MSPSDAARPPRKKPKTDATSLQRQQLEYLGRHMDQDHSIAPAGAASAHTSAMPPPPEFVNGVQGSSAGAGSGEFHVYKQSRRREMERLALMDAVTREEEEQAAFLAKREEQARKDAEKTQKNKAKRERAKLAREKGLLAEKERKAAAAAAMTTATATGDT